MAARGMRCPRPRRPGRVRPAPRRRRYAPAPPSPSPAPPPLQLDVALVLLLRAIGQMPLLVLVGDHLHALVPDRLVDRALTVRGEVLVGMRGQDVRVVVAV